VKNSQKLPWRAIHIENLSARGVEWESSLTLKEAFLRNASFRYTYLDLNKKNPYPFSKYVFDYAQHKAITHIGFAWAKTSLHLVTNASFPKKSNSYTTLDIEIKRQFKEFTVSVSGTNILNTDYQEFADYQGPGRWLKFSIEYAF
jgi:outer membrane receptor protein involved in Fe transport